MTMGLKLASAGDAKDDQKTQNVPENVAKTGRVSLFFCARGANYAQNQVARAERENSRREEWVREKRSSGYRTLLQDAASWPRPLLCHHATKTRGPRSAHRVSA